VLPQGENLGLRVCSSAGEPLNPEVVNWIKQRHFCPVKDHYGQTETGMTCCNFHGLEHPVRQGAMGYSSPGHKVVALNERTKSWAKVKTASWRSIFRPLRCSILMATPGARKIRL